MAIPIPIPLIEFLLFGPQDDRRQLQDSPILGDVWVEFGKTPSRALDLLISPFRGVHAGTLAAEIHKRLQGDPPVGVELRSLKTTDELQTEDWDKLIVTSVGASLRVQVFNDKGAVDSSFDTKKAKGLKGALKGLWPPHVLTAAEKQHVIALVEPGLSRSISGHDTTAIAHLQGLVAARLRFDQVLRVVIPTTKWWIDKWGKPSTDPNATPPLHRLQTYMADPSPTHGLIATLRTILEMAEQWNSQGDIKRTRELTPLDRFAALVALILWAGDHHRPGGTPKAEPPEDQIRYILKNVNESELAERARAAVEMMVQSSETPKPPYEVKIEPATYQISLNRVAMPALTQSVPAVKADAAKTLFKMDCSQIVWAVIDGGVDATHPAFRLPPYVTPQGNRAESRVKRIFDFKNFRRIVSMGNMTPAVRQANLDILLPAGNQLLAAARPNGFPRAEADRDLARLAEDADQGGPIHWELVQKFVELAPDAPPSSSHGTHVAGILGASREAARHVASGLGGDDLADGMCADITIYDFRVLGADVKDTEFAIIAALQFLRYLNARDKFLTIHGANLSLSIPHDVRNYACGRTPICDECERLVNSGVVVVAAAGNRGYQNFQTREGSYEGYAAFSITDPGNADGVITVGSTHRFWPHTYGVSFFSSRGPTGDGRLKPDLVAPGERIRAPFPGGPEDVGGEWGDLDGTSMAAPHVSGAAAMLMGRYSELIGQPRRIKHILCQSATDLGRERSFQGHGMLDVLRAFQSI